jgi:glutamyl-tRNA synthetase
LTTAIRTRFAPSPTGLLHIGGVRTALFSWAYAKRYGGQFILRIEDTDVERSTQASVEAILDGMAWLGLTVDEGPFYQMQRMERYQAVIHDFLQKGLAYRCYCSKEELEAMREAQWAKGEKPRYDGRWRDASMVPPEGVLPVIRFKNPVDGVVAWEDKVKGRIEVSNTELDDLIIARSDGTPTYNFCVVIDDWDMGITHVIRGEEHVNNTPRQINMLKALGAPIPTYAHLPLILREDGQKLSKRRDAVGVLDFQQKGMLPEGLLNYLARLGWGHGDDEIFSMDQFVSWFDLDHVSASPAKFDLEKLDWVNHQHIKQADLERLATLVQPFLKAQGVGLETVSSEFLQAVVGLLKDRSPTLLHLAEQMHYFLEIPLISASLSDQYLDVLSKNRLKEFVVEIEQIDWSVTEISRCMKETVAKWQVKMPQLAMPLRVAVCGVVNTPSIDQVLYLIGKDAVVKRIRSVLDPF